MKCIQKTYVFFLFVIYMLLKLNYENLIKLLILYSTSMYYRYTVNLCDTEKLILFLYISVNKQIYVKRT